MSLLTQVANQQEELAPETDSLGYSGPIESGVYPITVSMAYLEEASSGALGLVTHLVVEMEGGRTQDIRQTEYITSGASKGKKKYYTKDGVNMPLPGYKWGNSLCRLAAEGQEIDTFPTELKMINIYDYDQKKEVPQEREVLVGLLGKKALGAVLHTIEDKNIKDGNGNYVASGDTREFNKVDKFFHIGNRKTVAEILAQNGSETGAHIEAWIEKWAGVVKDTSTKTAPTASPATAGFGTAPAAGSAAPQPTESMFAVN